MSLFHDLGPWLSVPVDMLRDVSSAPWLVAGGFLFGAVHALLPGHGKTLLAGRYALARNPVARTPALRFALPLVDGLTLSATRVFLAFALVVGSVTLARSLGFAVPLKTLQIVAGALLLALAAHFLWAARARRDGPARQPIDASLLVLALAPEPMALAITSFGLAEGDLRAAVLVLAGLALGVGATLGLAATAARAARGGERVARLAPHAGIVLAVALTATGALTIAEALSGTG